MAAAGLEGKKQLGFNLALSGEGVPSLRSVLATGLVSRDAQEFGISPGLQIVGLGARASALAHDEDRRSSSAEITAGGNKPEGSMWSSL